MMKLFRQSVKSINKERYIIVKYFLQSSTNLKDAAWAIAVGQSIGNPTVRNRWETKELIVNHVALIIGNEAEFKRKKQGIVKIAFPLANLNIQEDGVTQLFVQIMGGHLDIDIIKQCHLLKIQFPPAFKLKGPRFGIKGIRKFTKVYDKPLLGGIIKPKVGMSSRALLGMVKEMVEGGVNFIKEDEIMANPSCCPLDERVPLVMDYLKDKNVIYAVCVNGDYPYVLRRVKQVYEYGGNAVHVNIWNGLGIYKAIRELDLPLFLFFQKSGDKILTNTKHSFHISWNVICQLAGMMGVDFIHAGMWGGYSSEDESVLKRTMRLLHRFNVLPSLSCGMHAGLIRAINRRFGVDYMANVGGAIHGHPGGTRAGVMALRQAIDGNYGKEYYQSVKKWGELE